MVFFLQCLLNIVPVGRLKALLCLSAPLLDIAKVRVHGGEEALGQL